MKPASQIEKIVNRILRNGRRPGDNTVLGTEFSRAAISLFLSLGVVVMVFNLPIYNNSERVSWRSSQRSEPIELMPEPEEIMDIEQIDGGLITRFNEEPEEKETPPEAEPDEEEGADEPEPMPRVTRLEKLEKSPILEFAEEGPAVVGGLGALYLNIDYPKIARDAGIQGLTVLMFVVEEDGSTTDISVLKSLHPACDSAAVAAVRRTLFKPGRQNGEIVRVKMRLPIRFRLIDPNIPTPDSLRQRS